MNILFITPSDPAQHQSGVAQRSALLHEALSRLGRVYTVIPTFLRQREFDDAPRRVRCVCIERRYGSAWILKHLLRRTIPLVVLPLYASAAPSRLYPGVTFDCVVVRHAEWAAYFAPWRIAPVILDMDDDPVEIFETLIRPRISWPARGLHGRIVRRWRDGVLARCHGVWVANADRQEGLPARRVAHLPNLALPPGPAYAAYGRQENQLVAVGSLGYAPHRDGVDRFVADCWPLLRQAFPDLRLVIAGRECPPRLARRWERRGGVSVAGYVEDLDDLYARSLMAVAPVYGGSGTSIKVVEALLHERHCLVTDFAVRGWPPETVTPANGLVRLGPPETLAATLRPLLQTIRSTPGYGRSFAALAARRFSRVAFDAAVAGMVARCIES
jgi:glycosyltransferase involved in cell wall biosynthesis